jgi:hypothetical protein
MAWHEATACQCALVGIVSASAFGILALAGLVCLVERAFGDSPR